jgi:hypothetical protein
VWFVGNITVVVRVRFTVQQHRACVYHIAQ